MIRIPIWTLQLAGLIVSAAIVLGAAWFILSAFLGILDYIPSAL